MIRRGGSPCCRENHTLLAFETACGIFAKHYWRLIVPRLNPEGPLVDTAIAESEPGSLPAQKEEAQRPITRGRRSSGVREPK